MMNSLSKAWMAIRGSEKARAILIRKIFENTKLRKLVYNYVMAHAGDLNDGKMIYDEMIVQLVKTLFSKTVIDHDGPLDPYLFTIAKFQWSKELKRRSRFTLTETLLIENEIGHQSSYEAIFLTEERRHILIKLLDKLKTNCRNVLMHWANGFSMVEIAQKMSYQSEGMARKKKSQCFKELLDYLATHPHIKNQLAHD